MVDDEPRAAKSQKLEEKCWDNTQEVHYKPYGGELVPTSTRSTMGD